MATDKDKTPRASLDREEVAAEAWAAVARQDFGAALIIWERMRTHFPEHPDGYVWSVHSLWRSGRLDEAESAATEAFARFPENPDLCAQYAWIAMSRERWSDALHWWAETRRRAPDRADAYIWAARAFWRSERLDEAEAIAVEAVVRFPEDADALAESAWVAFARQDWQEALRRWQRVYESDPDRHDGVAGTIRALRLVGRVGEAEKMASESLVRLPGDSDLMIEHVWTAASRNDWHVAAARLAAVRVTLKDQAKIEESLGPLERQIQLRIQSAKTARSSATTGPSPAAQGAASSTAHLSTAELLLSFESLGERCDFGAVQRKFGIEPLGLLRFAFSKLDALLAGLEDRFAAIGSIEDTEFRLYGDENIIYTRKYGLIYHTFVYEKDLSTDDKRATFQQQQRRRLAFLRDKLLSDLEDAAKIYVYSSDDWVADAAALQLFEALRAYGPNSLLYVRPARDDRPVGAVEVLEDGLYAGYFPGLTDFLSGAQPPFELWREICERTYGLARHSIVRSQAECDPA